MKFPEKISIPSDSTDLELVSVNKIKDGYEKDKTTPKFKIIGATYIYTKAEYFLNTNFYWSNEDFERNVKKEIIVPLIATQ